MNAHALTDRDVNRSTFVFALLAMLSVLLLSLLPSDVGKRITVKTFVISSGSFWFILSLIAFTAFWKVYYSFIYPDWARWLIPINFLLYGALGFLIYSIASRTRASFLIGCAMIGGIEGIAEHLVGIYRLGILERVPLFKGVHPRPVIIFSFFEYAFYWTLVAGLSRALTTLCEGSCF